MLLSELLPVLDALAPLRDAESWDNVGLLVGNPRHPVHNILLTIDYTPEVAQEALERSCDLVIAYHPPIFEPLKRLSPDSLVFQAIQSGIALYSPHTAADVAPGGTNDFLADVVGMIERKPLRPSPSKESSFRMVFTVPEAQRELVCQAVCQAGAGWIGNYSSCTFQSEGIGTFYGQPGTLPTVGKAGQLERVPEVRIEVPVPAHKIEPVLAALRAVHPYEEPAIDLYPLHIPSGNRGLGRVGTVERVSRKILLERIRKGLGLQQLLVAGPVEGEVQKIAVGAGACGDLIQDALKAKVELYLTGEIRHHDALKAAKAGMTVVCTLHSNSERAWLRYLKGQLEPRLQDVHIWLSEEDHDPFQVLS